MYLSAFRKETDTRGRTKTISKRYVLKRVLKKKNAKRTGTGGFPNKIQDGTAIK